MKHYKKNLYRLPLNLSVKDIHIDSDLDTLIQIEKICFSGSMQDSSKDFEEFFSDENSFGLILYQDGVPIGYFSGTHAYGIDDDDSDIDISVLINNAEHVCFIDSIAILPEYRSVITLDYLIHEIAKLVFKYDYHYLIAYARVKTGYSRILRQRYGAKVIKRYKNWQGFNEPFEFLYLGEEPFPILPIFFDKSFNQLRKLRRLFIKLNLIKPRLIKN